MTVDTAAPLGAKRNVIIVGVALPLLAVAAVLAFAWPSARTAPRDLPVGIVGTSPAAQAVVGGLEHAHPDGFDVRVYADRDAARDAIEHRDIYGAFVVSPGRVTVLDASAAGPAVAQLLDATGQQLAAKAHASIDTVDVVPLSADDPRGAVFTSSVLPLALGSIIAAAVIALFVRARPAWRQFATLTFAAAVVGTGVYLITQGFLGALPGDHFQTWGTLVLVVLAISCTVAGIYAIVGAAGIGIGSAVVVFVGNAFSGSTSAPEMLPDAVRRVGELLPPGAGASLLRSTAYFHGHGGGEHLAVLVGWIVFGAVALYLGHHPSGRFTIRRDSDTVPADPPMKQYSVLTPALISANGYHHDKPRRDAYAGAHEAR